MTTQGDLYLKSDKKMDNLPDSAEGKARCSLIRWFGIETQTDVLNCPKFNITFAYCVTVLKL